MAQQPNPASQREREFGDPSSLFPQQVRGFVWSRLGGNERSSLSLQAPVIKAVCRALRTGRERRGGSRSFPAVPEVLTKKQTKLSPHCPPLNSNKYCRWLPDGTLGCQELCWARRSREHPPVQPFASWRGRFLHPPAERSAGTGQQHFCRCGRASRGSAAWQTRHCRAQENGLDVGSQGRAAGTGQDRCIEISQPGMSIVSSPAAGVSPPVSHPAPPSMH